MTIQFWIEKRNRNWLQITAGLVVISFLFTTVSAPFAQANLWNERKKAVEELGSRETVGARGLRGTSTEQYKNSQSHLELASLSGLSLPASFLGSFNSQISPEALQQVLTKIQTQPKSSKNKNFIGIPSEFLSQIESYGNIERVYLKKGNHLQVVEGKLKSESSPLVFLIQDAHGIYGVQKNIALLLKELTTLGARIVGVEGAEGRIRGLDQYRNYPNKETLNGLAGYLMKKGLITGVEVAGLAKTAVSSGNDPKTYEIPGNVEFFGVEEQEKYLEQVKSFKDTLKDEKQGRDWVLEISRTLGDLKEKNYSAELKELDRNKEKYEQGEIKLGEWLEYLNGIRSSDTEIHQGLNQRGNWNLRGSGLLNIDRYLSAYRLEKSIDFKKVSEEQKKLLEHLSNKLNQQELTELLKESIAYRLGKIGYGEFYAGIKRRCEKAKLKITPELEKYMKYVAGVEGIEREKLFVEVKKVEEGAWISVAARGTKGDVGEKKNTGNVLNGEDGAAKGNVGGRKNRSTKEVRENIEELILIDKDYRLLKKAVDFKLSPEEWEEYDKRENEIIKIRERLKGLDSSVNIEQTVQSKKLDAKIALEETIQPLDHSISEILKNVSRFNKLSHERNQIFVNKLIARMEKAGNEESARDNLGSAISILVAGGYHSKGVEELLEKKGISFITIRPQMNASDIQKDYHPLNAFKRDLLPLEKMFLPEKVTLAPPLALANTESLKGKTVLGILNGVVVLDAANGKGGMRALLKDEEETGDLFTGVVDGIRFATSKTEELKGLGSDLENTGLGDGFEYGETVPMGSNGKVIPFASKKEKPSVLARAAALGKPLQQKSQKASRKIFANVQKVQIRASRQLKHAVNAPITIIAALNGDDSEVSISDQMGDSIRNEVEGVSNQIEPGSAHSEFSGIYLVAENHLKDRSLKDQLLPLAKGKKIVLGLEGLPKDYQDGFIFGIEYAPVHLFAILLFLILNIERLHLIAEGKLSEDFEKVIEEIKDIQVNFISHLGHHSKTLGGRCWIKLKDVIARNGSVWELYLTLNSYLLRQLSLDDLISTSIWRDVEAWSGLCKEYARIFGVELNRSLPPFLKLDEDELNKVLLSNNQRFFDDVMVLWRNKFFFENMIEISKKGLESGLPVIFIVGALHVPGLLEMFKGSSYAKYLTTVYVSPNAPQDILSLPNSDRSSKSAWNSLLTGLSLGFLTASLAHIVPHDGQWIEIAVFFMFGGFYFTHSLVILIAAVRAGLNKGEPDESKLIAEFRNLPPSQKNLNLLLTPCQFQDGQIHVNPRLMQFIHKGMQRIFYQHEENHRTFEKNRAAFEKAHPKLSKIPGLEEFIVSLQDFRFIFKKFPPPILTFFLLSPLLMGAAGELIMEFIGFLTLAVGSIALYREVIMPALMPFFLERDSFKLSSLAKSSLNIKSAGKDDDGDEYFVVTYDLSDPKDEIAAFLKGRGILGTHHIYFSDYIIFIEKGSAEDEALQLEFEMSRIHLELRDFGGKKESEVRLAYILSLGKLAVEKGWKQVEDSPFVLRYLDRLTQRELKEILLLYKHNNKWINEHAWACAPHVVHTLHDHILKEFKIFSNSLRRYVHKIYFERKYKKNKNLADSAWSFLFKRNVIDEVDMALKAESLIDKYGTDGVLSIEDLIRKESKEGGILEGLKTGVKIKMIDGSEKRLTLQLLSAILNEHLAASLSLRSRTLNKTPTAQDESDSDSSQQNLKDSDRMVLFKLPEGTPKWLVDVYEIGIAPPWESLGLALLKGALSLFVTSAILLIVYNFGLGETYFSFASFETPQNIPLWTFAFVVVDSIVGVFITSLFKEQHTKIGKDVRAGPWIAHGLAWIFSSGASFVLAFGLFPNSLEDFRNIIGSHIGMGTTSDFLTIMLIGIIVYGIVHTLYHIFWNWTHESKNRMSFVSATIDEVEVKKDGTKSRGSKIPAVNHPQWHGYKIIFSKEFYEDISRYPNLQANIANAMLPNLSRRLAQPKILMTGLAQGKDLLRVFRIKNGDRRLYFSFDPEKKIVRLLAFKIKAEMADGKGNTRLDALRHIGEINADHNELIRNRQQVNELKDLLFSSTPQEITPQRLDGLLEFIEDDEHYLERVEGSLLIPLQKSRSAAEMANLIQSLESMEDESPLSVLELIMELEQIAFKENKTLNDFVEHSQYPAETKQKMSRFVEGFTIDWARVTSHVREIAEDEFKNDQPDNEHLSYLYSYFKLVGAEPVSNGIQRQLEQWIISVDPVYSINSLMGILQNKYKIGRDHAAKESKAIVQLVVSKENGERATALAEHLREKFHVKNGDALEHAKEIVFQMDWTRGMVPALERIMKVLGLDFASAVEYLERILNQITLNKLVEVQSRYFVDKKGMTPQQARDHALSILSQDSSGNADVQLPPAMAVLANKILGVFGSQLNFSFADVFWIVLETESVLPKAMEGNADGAVLDLALVLNSKFSEKLNAESVIELATFSVTRAVLVKGCGDFIGDIQRKLNLNSQHAFKKAFEQINQKLKISELEPSQNEEYPTSDEIVGLAGLLIRLFKIKSQDAETIAKNLISTYHKKNLDEKDIVSLIGQSLGRHSGRHRSLQKDEFSQILDQITLTDSLFRMFIYLRNRNREEITNSFARFSLIAEILQTLYDYSFEGKEEMIEPTTPAVAERSAPEAPLVEKNEIAAEPEPSLATEEAMGETEERGREIQNLERASLHALENGDIRRSLMSVMNGSVWYEKYFAPFSNSLIYGGIIVIFSIAVTVGILSLMGIPMEQTKALIIGTPVFLGALYFYDKGLDTFLTLRYRKMGKQIRVNPGLKILTTFLTRIIYSIALTMAGLAYFFSASPYHLLTLLSYYSAAYILIQLLYRLSHNLTISPPITIAIFEPKDYQVLSKENKTIREISALLQKNGSYTIGDQIFSIEEVERLRTRTATTWLIKGRKFKAMVMDGSGDVNKGRTQAAELVFNLIQRMHDGESLMLLLIGLQTCNDLEFALEFLRAPEIDTVEISTARNFLKKLEELEKDSSLSTAVQLSLVYQMYLGKLLGFELYSAVRRLENIAYRKILGDHFEAARMLIPRGTSKQDENNFRRVLIELHSSLSRLVQFADHRQQVQQYAQTYDLEDLRETLTQGLDIPVMLAIREFREEIQLMAAKLHVDMAALIQLSNEYYKSSLWKYADEFRTNPNPAMHLLLILVSLEKDFPLESSDPAIYLRETEQLKEKLIQKRMLSASQLMDEAQKIVADARKHFELSPEYQVPYSDKGGFLQMAVAGYKTGVVKGEKDSKWGRIFYVGADQIPFEDFARRNGLKIVSQGGSVYHLNDKKNEPVIIMDGPDFATVLGSKKIALQLAQAAALLAQEQNKADNKSFINSLAVGVVLGVVLAAAAHFGIQHMGNFPEILAFFLAGGFHFTQSLVILIAAIRAGLNKGPTDESKLIPEFRNLPQEQKSLLSQDHIHHLLFTIKKIYRDFFIPCEVRDGKIYLNSRLMQFIPKGMQKIFYQHEENHRLFEVNHKKFTKIPGLEEFIVSLQDLTVNFVQNSSVSDDRVTDESGSGLGIADTAHNPISLGRIDILQDRHGTRHKYLEILKAKIQVADVIFIEETGLFDEPYNDISQGKRTPQEFLDFIRKLGIPFFSDDSIATLMTAIHESGKEIRGEEPEMDEVISPSEMQAGYQAILDLVYQGDILKAVQWYEELIRLIGQEMFNRDNRFIKQVKLFAEANPEANVLIIRGIGHVLPFEILKSEFSNRTVTKEFLAPNRSVFIFDLDNLIRVEALLQMAGLISRRTFTRRQLISAIASHLLLRALDENDRENIDITTLNKIAMRVDSIEKLAGLSRIMQQHPIQTKSDYSRNTIIWLMESGYMTPEEFSRMNGKNINGSQEETLPPPSRNVQEVLQKENEQSMLGDERGQSDIGTAKFLGLAALSFLLMSAAGDASALLDFVTGPVLSLGAVVFLSVKLFGQILLVMKKEEAEEADHVKFKRNRYSMAAGVVLGLMLIFSNLAKANSTIPLDPDPVKKGRILWSFEVHIPEFSSQFINVLEELRRGHKRVYSFHETAPPNLNWVRYLNPALAAKIESSSNLDDPNLKNELDIFLRTVYWPQTSQINIVQGIRAKVPGIDLNLIVEQDPLLLYLAEHPEIVSINEHATVETAISQLKADRALENARQQLYDLRNKDAFFKEMQKHREETYKMHLVRDRTDAKLLNAIIKYNPFSGIGVRRGSYHRHIYKLVDAGDRSQDIFLPTISLPLDRGTELYRQNIERGLKNNSSLTRKDYLLEFPSESVKFLFKPTSGNVGFFDKIFGNLSESDLERLTNDIQKYSSLFYADINQKEPSAWMNRLGMFTLLWLKENGFISAQTFKQLEFASENSRAYVLSATISDFIQSLQQQRHSYLDVKPKTPVSLALSGLGLYALSFVLTGASGSNVDLSFWLSIGGSFLLAGLIGWGLIYLWNHKNSSVEREVEIDSYESKDRPSLFSRRLLIGGAIFMIGLAGTVGAAPFIVREIKQVIHPTHGQLIYSFEFHVLDTKDPFLQKVKEAAKNHDKVFIVLEQAPPNFMNLTSYLRQFPDAARILTNIDSLDDPEIQESLEKLLSGFKPISLDLLSKEWKAGKKDVPAHLVPLYDYVFQNPGKVHLVVEKSPLESFKAGLKSEIFNSQIRYALYLVSNEELAFDLMNNFYKQTALHIQSRDQALSPIVQQLMKDYPYDALFVRRGLAHEGIIEIVGKNPKFQIQNITSINPNQFRGIPMVPALEKYSKELLSGKSIPKTERKLLLSFIPYQALHANLAKLHGVRIETLRKISEIFERMTLGDLEKLTHDVQQAYKIMNARRSGYGYTRPGKELDLFILAWLKENKFLPLEIEEQLKPEIRALPISTLEDIINYLNRHGSNLDSISETSFTPASLQKVNIESVSAQVPQTSSLLNKFALGFFSVASLFTTGMAVPSGTSWTAPLASFVSPLLIGALGELQIGLSILLISLGSGSLLLPFLLRRMSKQSKSLHSIAHSIVYNNIKPLTEIVIRRYLGLDPNIDHRKLHDYLDKSDVRPIDRLRLKDSVYASEDDIESLIDVGLTEESLIEDFIEMMLEIFIAPGGIYYPNRDKLYAIQSTFVKKHINIAQATKDIVQKSSKEEIVYIMASEIANIHSEEDYLAVANLGDISAMMVYVERVAKSMGLKVVNRDRLQQFAARYIARVKGITKPVSWKGIKSLKHMEEALRKGKGQWLELVGLDSEFEKKVDIDRTEESNQSGEKENGILFSNEDGQAMSEYGLMVGGLAGVLVFVSKLVSGYPGMGEVILASLLLLGGVGLILYGTVKLAQRLQMDSSLFFLQPTEIFGLNLRLNSGQNNGKELKEMEKIEERFKRLRGYLNADETAKAEKEIKKIERLKRNYLSQAKAGLVTSQRNKKALNLLAMGLSLALVTNPSEAQSKAVEDQMRSIVRNEVSVNLPVEPILSSSIGEHSQDYWTGDVEVSDKIEMSQEEINEFEETAWKVAVLAKWASSKAEYKDISSLASIGEDLPGAIKTFDGTALFGNAVNREMVEGSILNELRRGGEEKIALTAAYGVSKGKMQRVVERLIEKELDKDLIQAAKDRMVYLSASKGKRVVVDRVVNELKSLGLGELGVQIVTDDPLRLEESMQFNIRVKIYKLMSATMVIEFKTLRDIAEEMKEFRLIHINA